MKIKYITEDGLLLLKNNASSAFKEIIKNKKTLRDFLEDDNYIKESNLEIDEIVLDTETEKGKETKTDIENIIRVYNHLKDLTDSQASDERIWVAFTLDSHLEYMKYRWNVNNEEEFLNRYFFNYSAQRSLFRNGMSRLWWIGRVTYDKNRMDPYELTKFICRDQDFIESICGRNIFNNFDVMKATVVALYDYSRNGGELSRNLVRSVTKYINLLAGTYIIDFLDYETIYLKVKTYIDGYKEV